MAPIDDYHNLNKAESFEEDGENDDMSESSIEVSIESNDKDTKYGPVANTAEVELGHSHGGVECQGHHDALSAAAGGERVSVFMKHPCFHFCHLCVHFLPLFL